MGQPVGFTDFFGYLVGEQLLTGVSVYVTVFKGLDLVAVFYQHVFKKIKLKKNFHLL